RGRPSGARRAAALAPGAARRDAAGRSAAGRHKVRVASGVGPARRPHRGVQRARLPDRPRERVAGARAPRSPGARAGDRPDARGMGVRASRHRPGRRDAAGERRAELPDREAHRRGPLPAPVPGSPVSPLAAAPRLLVVGSANVDFTVAARHLPRPGETVSGGTLLVSHGGKGANQAVAARRLGEARRRGRLTLLNPAPMREEARELVALADYLTPNETEAERLSGVVVRDPGSAAAAGRALQALGASTVVVTLGAQGALACTPDGLVRAPALPVAVVDTTAAGDAFSASLALAMSKTSAPAASAVTAAVPSPHRCSMAPIRRSSVTTGPSNPSSPRRSSVMVARESVAGNSGSSARLKTCAVMTASASRSASSMR